MVLGRFVLMRRIHLTMTVVWTLLAIPTLLIWKNSILWVAFMSLYANMASHWSAYQASRAEQKVEANGGDCEV